MPDFKQILPTAQAVDAVVGGKLKNLPSVSVVVDQLFKLTQNQRTTIDELAKVVQTDPGLSTAVLRRVNGASFGAPRKVLNIKDAVIMLGFDAIREISLETIVYEQVVKNRHMGLDPILFWRHSLVVAVIGRALARQMGFQELHTAYCAGLLHDIGKIIIECCASPNYSEIIERLRGTHLSVAREEIRLIGLGHDALGGYFCNEWGFPSSVTLAVALHHKPYRQFGLTQEENLLIAIVTLSNFIANTYGLGAMNTLTRPMIAPEVAELVDIGKIDFDALLAESDHGMAAVSSFYNFNFPEPLQLRSTIARANLTLGYANGTFYYRSKNDDPVVARQEAPDTASNPVDPPQRSLIAEDILLSTLTAIQHDFAYDRLYAFSIEHEKRRLVLRHALNPSSDNPLPIGYAIELVAGLKNILMCLRDNAPVILEGNSPEETALLDAFKAQQLGFLPITYNRQVRGIIALDCSISMRALIKDHLILLSGLTSELGHTLEQVAAIGHVKKQALIDPLTEIYNAGSIEGILNIAFDRARQGYPRFAVLLVHIDHFKQLNDAFGQSVGTDILKMVASLVRTSARSTDHVGRFGGEDFLCVLNNIRFDQAIGFGERLREKVEKLGKTLEHRLEGRLVTVSVGVAVFSPEAEASYRALLNAAACALREAKKAGRNRVVGFNEGKMIGVSDL